MEQHLVVLLECHAVDSKDNCSANSMVASLDTLSVALTEVQLEMKTVVLTESSSDYMMVYM